jgi:hypothetical protein
VRAAGRVSSRGRGVPQPASPPRKRKTCSRTTCGGSGCSCAARRASWAVTPRRARRSLLARTRRKARHRAQAAPRGAHARLAAAPAGSRCSVRPAFPARSAEQGPRRRLRRSGGGGAWRLAGRSAEGGSAADCCPPMRGAALEVPGWLPAGGGRIADGGRRRPLPLGLPAPARRAETVLLTARVASHQSRRSRDSGVWSREVGGRSRIHCLALVVRPLASYLVLAVLFFFFLQFCSRLPLVARACRGTW